MLIQKRQLLRALAASGLLSAGATPAFAAAPVVGQPAPNFEATTFTGAKITLLPDLKGKVVLLNFWATWCAPCKTELPLLDHYYSAGKQYGLRMLAVTTEDSASAAELRRLVPLLDMPMIRRLRGPYRVLGGVPTSYVIDRAGMLRYAKAGAFTLDVLNAVLIPLLKESAPEDAALANTAISDPGLGFRSSRPGSRPRSARRS
jgi:thiol-disulfide isomerase/thioredoxin